MNNNNSHLVSRLFLSFCLTILFRTGFTQNVDHWETVVRSYDIWRYIIPTSEPPSDWNTPGFDDSSWQTGKGNIGYGEIDDSTILTPPINSVYLRITLQIIDSSVISNAILHVDYDDGFVAYLNGHEIARANIGIAGDRPPYDAFAVTCHEAAMPTGGVPPSFLINNDSLSRYLLNGNNVLALQVHNCSLTSSDLSTTTFFSVGITNGSTYYYAVPAWFNVYFGTTSKLPIIAIDTYGQTIPDNLKIMAWCKVINNGKGIINDMHEAGTDYDGPIGIELRGQSSLMFPKKPYSIGIRKTETIDSTASLLGMPSNNDWVLYPPYSDKTMLRNVISFYLGSKMGSWQPRCRFCVVYLNGEYLGIYVLMEHISRDVNRVNISGLGEQETSGDQLTGGYIIKADKLDGLTPDEYFTTTPGFMIPNTRNYTFTYVYPKADKINNAQKNYIQSFLTTSETVLNSDNFRDPVNGIRKFFDYSSFADHQIMQELSNNVDGYRLSTFFYKMKITHGDKLFAGALWDLDLAYANANYYDYNFTTSGWLYPHYAPDWEHPMHWWARLMEDPDYVRRFVTKWHELRKGSFRTDSIMNFIDTATTYLGDEIRKNYQKWPILGTWIWPNYYVGSTYQDEIDFLKNWITDRLAWMDSATDLNSDLYHVSFSDGVTIFPIPVKDILHLIVNQVSTERITIELIDLSGRKIYENFVASEVGGNQEIIVEMSQLSIGFYILRVRQGSRLIGVKKVTKY